MCQITIVFKSDYTEPVQLMCLWQNEENWDRLSIHTMAHRILDTVRMGVSNKTFFSQFYFYENEKVQKIPYP